MKPLSQGSRSQGPRSAGSKPSHRPSTAGSSSPGEQLPVEASSPRVGSGRGPRAWQPRFGIGGLFLVVLIASVMAAAGSYLARTLFVGRPQDARQSQLAFLLFTMAAPPLLMVLLALCSRFIRRR